MNKYLRFTVYLNLIIAVLSAFMAFNLWNADRSKAYIFVFLAVITTFMFFFRRHYLNKFEQRKRDNQK
jgi:amino acid transporter